MVYLFYLDSVLLPVTPSKLQIKVNNQNNTMNLINDGEINILKKAGLTDITFDALLPNIKYPFSKYEDGFEMASYFMDKLEDLKVDESPFQFIITRELPDGGSLFNTNIKVSLEDYTLTEETKNGFDVVATIKLRQYKSYGVKTVTITESEQVTVEETRETTNSPEPSMDQSYTVVSGDTLWAIAKKYYGNGSNYTYIVSANSISNPNLIYPGQVLTIPAL